MIKIESVDGLVLYAAQSASDVRTALNEAVIQEANLQGANLQGANLRRADIKGADLRRANLQGTYLQGADLRGANLQEANLRVADLRGADLQGANLEGAYLRGADLRRADLRVADLQGADLRGANLQGANLRRANLQEANLQGANLQGANLQGADLQGAKNTELIIARTRILPDEGDVIGWKRARDSKIVKLRIPDGTARSHALGRQCRAAEAIVLAIFTEDGQSVESATSSWDDTFNYGVGETVRPTQPFDIDIWNECASGIHFWITRAEAEAHQ